MRCPRGYGEQRWDSASWLEVIEPQREHCHRREFKQQGFS